MKQKTFQPTAAVVSSDFTPLPRWGRPPRSWDRDVTMPEGMGVRVTGNVVISTKGRGNDFCRSPHTPK